MSEKGTLVEDKMHRFKGGEHFSFFKCLIYTDDDASAKFSTNPHETNNSVFVLDMKTGAVCCKKTKDIFFGQYYVCI